MSQASPELTVAAAEPLRRLSLAAAAVLPKRSQRAVQRFEAPPGGSIGTLDPGKFALYGLLAANAASPPGRVSTIMRYAGDWLIGYDGWEPGRVARIDVQRLPLGPPRSQHTQTNVTLSSPAYTKADGRYGLDIGVRTRDGVPYDGWLSVASLYTHHYGEPATVAAFNRTHFTESGQIPGRPSDAYSELQRRAHPAIVAAGAAILGEAVQMVEAIAGSLPPDITATRLLMPQA